MAKVKVLADRISISSEILTDEKLEKVLALAPAALKLYDEVNGETTYQVIPDVANTFSSYGACFKEGKTLGIVPECIESIEDKEVRESKIKAYVSSILLKINAIEAAVECVELPEFDSDIEFLD